MKIVLKKEVLMVEQNEGSELSHDIYIVKGDDDKNLITCTVIEWTESYPTGSVIITGKYSLNKLVYKWKDYNFLEEIDIIWTIND